MEVGFTHCSPRELDRDREGMLEFGEERMRRHYECSEGQPGRNPMRKAPQCRPPHEDGR